MKPRFERSTPSILKNYRTPEQFSFSHIYFSADRPVESPEQRADVLAAKAVEDPTLSGDPFMLPVDANTRDVRPEKWRSVWRGFREEFSRAFGSGTLAGTAAFRPLAGMRFSS